MEALTPAERVRGFASAAWTPSWAPAAPTGARPGRGRPRSRSRARACIFVVVDHCTAECLGVHASASGSTHEALEPLRQGVRKVLRGYGASVAQGRPLRHDHGSQYMSLSHDFQQELPLLGIRSTPSFVAEPECNGVAECFVRTLKEQLLWARTFETIDELRVALIAVMRRYDESWLVHTHDYLTPDHVRKRPTQPAALSA